MGINIFDWFLVYIFLFFHWELSSHAICFQNVLFEKTSSFLSSWQWLRLLTLRFCMQNYFIFSIRSPKILDGRVFIIKVFPQVFLKIYIINFLCVSVSRNVVILQLGLKNCNWVWFLYTFFDLQFRRHLWFALMVDDLLLILFLFWSRHMWHWRYRRVHSITQRQPWMK